MSKLDRNTNATVSQTETTTTESTKDDKWQRAFNADLKDIDSGLDFHVANGQVTCSGLNPALLNMVPYIRVKTERNLCFIRRSKKGNWYVSYVELESAKQCVTL